MTKQPVEAQCIHNCWLWLTCAVIIAMEVTTTVKATICHGWKPFSERFVVAAAACRAWLVSKICARFITALQPDHPSELIRTYQQIWFDCTFHVLEQWGLLQLMHGDIKHLEDCLQWLADLLRVV
jgi:hypothetical protein